MCDRVQRCGRRYGRQTVQWAHLSDVTDREDGALLWGVAAGVKADVEVAAGLARAGLDPVSDVSLLALRGLESHVAWEHDLLVCLIQPWDEDGDLAVLGGVSEEVCAQEGVHSRPGHPGQPSGGENGDCAACLVQERRIAGVLTLFRTVRLYM